MRGNARTFTPQGEAIAECQSDFRPQDWIPGPGYRSVTVTARNEALWNRQM
jgi:hypothetical protein